MQQLSEDDIKFFLSIDPDEEAVRKAIESINSDIESAKVKKIKVQIERQVEDNEESENVSKKSSIGKFFHGLTQGAAPTGKKGEDSKPAPVGIKGDGTVGTISAAIGTVLKGASKAAEFALKGFNAGLRILSTGLREMQGPLGGIGAGLHIVSDLFSMLSEGIKKIPGVGGILGPVMDQLAKMPAILGEILSTGLNFASKANPGVMRQLSIAMEDAMATIGQAFVPVVEEMIPVMREIGTIIAQALPSNEEMRDMFRDLFESIKELIQELAPLIGPLLKGLVWIIKQMTNALIILAKAFKFVYEVVRLLIKGLTLGFVDLGKIQDKNDPKNRGQISAARTPWMGSIDEFQKRLQMQTAYGPRSMGPESLPNNVGKMAGSVENIEKWFQRMDPEKFKEIVRAGTDKRGDTRGIINASERGLN